MGKTVDFGIDGNGATNSTGGVIREVLGKKLGVGCSAVVKRRQRDVVQAVVDEADPGQPEG